MKSQGFEVTLISSPGQELNTVADREGIAVMAVPIAREIHPLRDLLTLIRLYRTIAKLKPHIINVSTPKAGFLGMLAAWMNRVPARIYTLRGLRLETKSGLTRRVLTLIERGTSFLSDITICVSRSLRDKAILFDLVRDSGSIVLGDGSSNGIDINRFQSADGSAAKAESRNRLGIPQDALVIGFIGRLTQDKGISELLDSFEILAPRFANLYLLIVGDFESGDPVSSECRNRIIKNSRIVRQPFLTDPLPAYRAIDVLAFPSRREGFPNAPLEAAALGIPTVGFFATGVVDAIEDGRTGRIVPAGDVQAFSEAISSYLEDETKRTGHGSAARERAMQLFNQERIWNELHRQYLDLLKKNKVVLSNEIENIPAVTL